MKTWISYFIASLFLFLLALSVAGQKKLKTEVLVIGGGVGGTAAGIQCARLGISTIIVESAPWLGGMLTAAGVSAADGNHYLPSGLWAEFRNRIYKVYGGPDKVATGWVSHTLFEPRVGDSLFKAMAGAEKNLAVLFHYRFLSIDKKGDKISAVHFIHVQSGEKVRIEASVFIDATELGDVMAAAKVPYDTGMEAGQLTGEKAGVNKSNEIIQDLTYVGILKDYGLTADCTISRPANYTPAEFDGSNTDYYKDKTRKAPTVDAKKMLQYGKLPKDKYMLNWPLYGNDTYLNVIQMEEEERQRELAKAKETTLRFIYFIQHQLGFKNLGLADDEFPTPDRLALIPYHREGRRGKGLVRFTQRHIAEPFTYADPLYRTGIAVGDYPIDHHHKKNTAAPQHLDFYPVPSFSVPMGVLIPQKVSNLVLAEKGISVSNVANGTTRLQPCVMLTGQAAGVLAAIAVKEKGRLKDVPVRKVQSTLLAAKAYLMPYIDVPPDHPYFEAVQRAGATGILKGKGIPYKWANQTWFYPDSAVERDLFIKDFSEYDKLNVSLPYAYLTLQDAIEVVYNYTKPNNNKKPGLDKKEFFAYVQKEWMLWSLKNFDLTRKITRSELAVLLDKTINPFRTPVNHKGYFMHAFKK